MAEPAGSPFVGDAGPGFNPEEAAAGAEQVRREQDAEARAEGLGVFELPPVSEEQVHTFLFNLGDGAHAIVGVGDYDWVMTQRDLERIVPPATRILNRYDTAKALAAYSDELAVLVGVGLYTWRSLLERHAILRQHEREDRPAPAPGYRQPPPPPPPPPPPAPPPPVHPTPHSGPEAGPSAPAPAPPAGPGAFPGAGAPATPEAANVTVADGYVTHAERLRAAQERRPSAVPREAPGPTS